MSTVLCLFDTSAEALKLRFRFGHTFGSIRLLARRRLASKRVHYGGHHGHACGSGSLGAGHENDHVFSYEEAGDKVVPFKAGYARNCLVSWIELEG